MRTAFLPREFYIPKNAVSHGDYTAVNAVVVYEIYQDGRYSVLGFSGKRSKPDFHYAFKSRDGMDKYVSQYIAGLQRAIDNKAARKAEQAEQGRYLTTAAQCAAAIRSLLSLTYPDIKFRVTSSNFAGGDAVHVSYTDGPAANTIEHLLSQYEKGSFDGMNDIYEYTNVHHDQPQTKYLQVQRKMSDAVRLAIAEELGIAAADIDGYNVDAHEWNSTLIYRVFHKRDC